MKTIYIILLSVIFLYPITEIQAQKKKKKDKKPVVEVNINTKEETKPAETTTNLQPIQVTDNTAVVEAKGVGIKREDALQDALRNAVGQAVGVSITSETKVENYIVLQDAISSRSQGYITKYDVLKRNLL